MVLVESFSGIRGVYPKEMNVDIASRYAQAFLNVIGPQSKLVVGRDTRASGEGLSRAVLDATRNAIDVGVLPTPAIEEAVRAFKADGGVIITASHNPPEFNGFKFLGKTGAVLEPEMMGRVITQFHELKKLTPEAFLEAYLYTDVKRNVETRSKEALEKYARFLDSFFTKEDKKQMATARLLPLLDPNGGTGIVAKQILQRFGIQTISINNKPGVFKREIEPTEKSLKGLVKELKKSKAQFAAAFDCDADRVELLLPDGTLVSGNHLFALLVKDSLQKKKREQEAIVANDATSYLVKEVVEDLGGRWVEVEVGETNVVRVMGELRSPIGGEGSNGGIIVAPSKCRDGILTVLLLCRMLSREKKNLKTLLSELPDYVYLKEKVIGVFKRENIKKFYLKKGFTLQETGDETGGLKALTQGGWVWFRQSKTEPNVVRVIADSRDSAL
ncbi:MAG: hypothetical protein Q7S65_03020, partial [Nanoarchaeota archaeon]|nr:hypothetical protein [Nanoarchaeota archaeon]